MWVWLNLTLLERGHCTLVGDCRNRRVGQEEMQPPRKVNGCHGVVVQEKIQASRKVSGYPGVVPMAEGVVNLQQNIVDNLKEKRQPINPSKKKK